MLSLREAAKKFGYSYQHLWQLVKQGKIPAQQIEGKWFVQRKDIDAYYSGPNRGRQSNAKHSNSAVNRRLADIQRQFNRIETLLSENQR